MSVLGLEQVGITSVGNLYHNLSYEKLFEHEMKNEEGVVSSLGAVSVDTGKFTGRSPKDKYFVEEASSAGSLWWGNVNRKISEKHFNTLWKLAQDQLNGSDLYVTDGYCGANENTRMKIRIVSQIAWQSHFVKNMFIRPDPSELENFSPEFTILNSYLCSFHGKGVIFLVH